MYLRMYQIMYEIFFLLFKILICLKILQIKSIFNLYS